MAESNQTNFSDNHYFDLSHPKNRIVVKHGDTVLADSDRPALVKEKAYKYGILDGVYYLPPADVKAEYLEKLADYSTHCPIKGDSTYYNVTAGGDTVEKGAWAYDQPTVDSEPIKSHIAFDPRKFTIISHPLNGAR
jgi:uncharacterized protein (DUF427 family)